MKKCCCFKGEKADSAALAAGGITFGIAALVALIVFIAKMTKCKGTDKCEK